jgi:hypothetical protein
MPGTKGKSKPAKKQTTQWHLGILAAFKREFAAFKKFLTYEVEHYLTTDPL